jgi:uncharacterized repeat protein (TIGR03843 family)
MPYSSNATLLVEARLDGETVLGVYKPVAGERPLWDFPTGLARRELATFVLDHTLGWDLVPPTIVRSDAPHGEGSIQLFVDHDPNLHYFVLHESGNHHDELRRLCALDLVANSADRKSGHVLVDQTGRVRAIDNGLTFHAQLKLRTVVWDYSGEPLPDDVRAGLESFVEIGLPDTLSELLDPFERDAVRARSEALLETGCFPHDPSGRRWPWPLV